MTSLTDRLRRIVTPKDEDSPSHDADIELGQLNDDDWRQAHEQLRGVIPDDELDYTWEPNQ